MPVEVDVVIPTRDRPGPLAECLEGLARQTFAPIRVILVDDGSQNAITGGPDALDGRLVVLRNESPAGPAASRNRGIEAGDAPFVVFLDDDVRPSPQLLARHHQALTGRVGSVVSLGPLLAPPGIRLAPWDLWEADRMAREYARLARGEAVPSWTHLYTGNAGVRREDLVRVGGFDAAFPRQDDMELGYRLAAQGCEFVFDPEAIAWHAAARSLPQWLALPRASAEGDLLMDRLHVASGRLAAVDAALASRRGLLRLARHLFRHPAASRFAVRGAVTAGRALYGIRATRLALPAFSVAWDLEYNRALAAARRADG